MRRLNRFKSIKALLAVLVMPFLMTFGLGDVLADNYLDKTQKLAENIWVGPQIDAKAVKDLKAAGVMKVVNFRTEAEMNALPFDQAAVLKAEQLSYDLIPVGKSLGYTPQQVADFNALMSQHGDEKLLLHCRSGFRANLVYAAWLIKYQGMDKASAKNKVHKWSDEAIDQLLGLEVAE